MKNYKVIDVQVNRKTCIDYEKRKRQSTEVLLMELKSTRATLLMKSTSMFDIRAQK